MKPHSLTDYLTFLNKEKKGVIAFIALAVLLKFTPHLYSNYVQSPEDEKLLEFIEDFEEKNKTASEKSQTTSKKITELYAFDPSKVTGSELKSFGLPDRAITSWIKARENGFKFFSKESVKSIYGLDSISYTRIESFISIPESSSKRTTFESDQTASSKASEKAFIYNSKNKVKSYTYFHFDPNNVTRDELLNLGLKDFVADNLLNWREKGKVFRSAEDVKSVHGLRPSDFERIEPYIRISTIETLSPKTTESFSDLAKESIKPEPKVFKFNPNEIDEETLLSYGIRTMIVKRWRKYIEAGGYFSKPEDIGRIYGISEKEYDRLINYVEIPDRSGEQSDELTHVLNDKSEERKKPKIIDINYSKAEEWASLNLFSEIEIIQIQKFQQALGGFHSLSQLLELHFIDAAKLAQISNKLTLHSYNLRKLNINNASKEKLQLHPYIKYNIAKDIIKKRKRKGPFSSEEDILALDLFDESTFRKLAPYLEY